VKRPRVPYMLAGLTVVEVLVAIAVLGIVTAAVTGVYVSSIRHNSDSGLRTQIAHILNAAGRRVAGADSLLLAQVGEPLEWEYGQLRADFPDMSGDGFADPDRVRLTVTNVGTVRLGTAEVTIYEVTVCGRAQVGAQELCITGRTASVPPGPPIAGEPHLPGIN
jgi:type II secretory pathway pseudopilin PulG